MCNQYVEPENTYVVSTKRLNATEAQNKKDFLEYFLHKNPVVSDELMDNLGLFIPRRALGRILYMQELYQKILGVQGVVMEFGCRWGQNLALFTNFRGLYEPYKVGREIIGFDTFSGFLDVQAKDGTMPYVKKGAYQMPERYHEELERILYYHEQESPISHLQKYKVIQGDASQKIVEYLDEHPETIIAMAYFDMDLYQPTKDCLEAILPHMPKGAVLAMDELNYFGFPGETVALHEVLGINNCEIRYSSLYPSCSYIVL